MGDLGSTNDYTSEPIKIANYDFLQFGSVKTTVYLVSLTTPTPTENIEPSTTAIIKCSCGDIAIPERVVNLVIVTESRPNLQCTAIRDTLH